MATNETDRLIMMARQSGKTNMANEEIHRTELLARLGLAVGGVAHLREAQRCCVHRPNCQHLGGAATEFLSAIARLRDEAASVEKSVMHALRFDGRPTLAKEAEVAFANLADMGALLALVLR